MNCTLKDDLRVLKTRKALYSALHLLLCRQKFSKITVQNICAEALVSRTAFYAHFKDKFDLLEQWLNEQKQRISQIFFDCADLQEENVLYENLHANSVILTNLLNDADREQQKLLLRFFTPEVKHINREYSETAANFIAGGIFNVILFQITEYRKTNEDDMKNAIHYMYRMICTILSRDI